MTDHELLLARTAALARVVAQLDAVRELHKPALTVLVDKPVEACRRCRVRYPCPTARAAGVVTP
jgi:hypothetical protein